MKRRALLIGCPGKGNGFLPGVKKDIENYKEYLKSNNGGKWYDDEIISLYDSSISSIESSLRKIKMESPDVVICVFSGHGSYSSLRDCRKLYIDNENYIYENELLNLSLKQITIIDTCAGIEHEPIFDSAIIFSLEERANNLINYRKKYEDEVTKCGYQSIKLYACDVNEYSSDTSKGGLYSYNLIKWAKNNKANTLSALQVHESAAAIVSNKTKYNNPSQNPQYECSVRIGYKLPFSLGSSM